MEPLKHIIEGCINNEGKCQKIFYEHYYGYALKSVFRYIYRYERATDVVNDGFVKIFRNFKNFRYSDEENLEKIVMGWIRRILINTAVDELRRQNMMPEVGDLPEHLWQEPDNELPPDQLIIYKELILQLKRLPPSYRTVFNMFVIDGYTHQEIANELSISVGTSKSTLFKAKAFLKNYLNNQVSEADVCSI
ncbi:MAG: sigma-70 family RNA polymerase sigma factor [Parafilimonas sp.]